MYVRVRLLDSDSQSYHINCRSINETMDELRDKVARKWNVEDCSLVRLFFDGKELINGHSLYEYNIKVNNVIQVMLRRDSVSNKSIVSINDSILEQNDECIEEMHYKDEQLIQEDEYYRVGDRIDALNTEIGAWFEAKIIKISSNSSLEYRYYVDFEKVSIGTNIPLLLHQIRPQSSVIISYEDIKEGDLVLANFNNNITKERGYWYECKVEKKVELGRKLYATIFMGEVALKRQQILFINEIYKIETNIKRNQRSKDHQVLCKPNRYTPPDCNKCNDNTTLRCKKCSCNECGGKNAPEKQIICDECDSIYHIWCLAQPLSEVPHDDWYCNNCRNSDDKEVTALQSIHLQRRKKNLNRVGIKEWGRGMACMGRTQICNIVGKDHFGPIPGIQVGMWWRFRFQASEAGVHTPLVAGIHGKEICGAYSIVFSCSYDEDIDLGDQFYYTASGGKDLTGKSRVGGPQTKDQQLKRCNKALAVNCFAPLNDEKGANAGLDWQKGKPVRVLRSGNARGATKKSPYLPKVGVRYDGIYKVVKYWPQIGESGFLVWRFLMRRDDPTPPPWTKDGKNRMKRLGLTIIYPPGWNQDTASKRSWKMDENVFRTKKLKVSPFSISKEILKLIESDKLNSSLWQTLLCHAKHGKLEFFQKLEENFKCVCCLDVVKFPVTTPCCHNICKSCLERSFESGVNTCPICRTLLVKAKRKLNINNTLNQILTKLFD